MLEQACRRLRNAAVPLAGALGSCLGEMAGQADVFGHRKKGQQVELLEDVAGVVDPEAIPSTGRQRGEVGAEQLDRSALGFLYAANQSEQGRLAAARRTLEKQALVARQREAGDVEQLCLARPGKTQLVQFEQRCGHRDDPCQASR